MYMSNKPSGFSWATMPIQRRPNQIATDIIDQIILGQIGVTT